jgi:predicted nuclease of predicted toxin-antitoxin system
MLLRSLLRDVRWLLDQGLPRSAASKLRLVGHDALHVGDICLASAADSAILRRAAAEERIVATLDADFHALLANSLTSSPSVVRIRDEGMKAAEVTTLLLQLSEQFVDQLLAGCAMTVRAGRVRYRLLPLS